MTLETILPPERTLFDVPGGSKKRVLEFFSTFIAQNTPSLDSQEVFSRLIGRERLGSTGIGHGVAIPHSRNPHCKAPIAGFLKLAEPIDFDASTATLSTWCSCCWFPSRPTTPIWPCSARSPP